MSRPRPVRPPRARESSRTADPVAPPPPGAGNTAGAMALTAVINTVTLPVRLMALPQAVDLWLEYRRRQQPQEPAGDSGTAGQDPEPPPIRAS